MFAKETRFTPEIQEMKNNTHATPIKLMTNLQMEKSTTLLIIPVINPLLKSLTETPPKIFNTLIS